MSKIEVDAIDKQSGSTLTLGGSGTAVTLACGATQTGFGRTGTVDWQTGSIKTSTFTAANGEGYFANTSGGAFTMNLPAGSAGAIVSVQDYNNTFDSNALTVAPNGSEKINSGAGSIALDSEGEGLTLVYIDGTVGWRSIQDSAFSDVGSNFIVATGGTITTSGNDKIHTFTGPGTFTVTTAAVCAANNVVSHLVIAGGGGGGSSDVAGGGGAGGYREVVSPSSPYSGSPLNGYPSAPNRVTVTATAFPITVGAGGAVSCTIGNTGSNSIFSTIISAGGGAGGKSSSSTPLLAGGSGGGTDFQGTTGGSGNTPPTSPAQGNPGGRGQATPPANGAGAGGGAGAVGGNGSGPVGGTGGAGATSSINGTPTARAGGGGGAGGTGPVSSGNGVAGTANTGGGGGGADSGQGAAGGSGIVIIRYKFQ